MSDYLYPEATEILFQAVDRHQGPLAFAFEAIELAHLAEEKLRDYAASLIPGTPGIRRVRNDINDTVWRMLHSIGDPLVSDRRIREFRQVEGGEVMIMPDGLHMRIKKGGPDGATANYKTKRIKQMATCSKSLLFSAATALDGAIVDGMMIDVVFVASEAMGTFEHIGVRFAAVEDSPLVLLDPPSVETLRLVSPLGYELSSHTRNKLAS